MNKDINYTLAALVPLLRMNGEKVVSVEAVEDWYEIDGREYMKEVAEITYENGYRQYADIGCDANLTAVYDVIRVIQQVKPKSEKIERIVRDVYPKPEVPDTNVGDKAQLSDKGTTFENGGEIKRWSKDIISRQALIEEIENRFDVFIITPDIVSTIECFPPAEPKRGKWVDDGDPLMLTCGNCGYGVMRYNNTPFCPNCGADMRGEQNETD